MNLTKTTFNLPASLLLTAKQVSLLENTSNKPSLVEFISDLPKRPRLSDKQKDALYRKRLLRKYG